MFARLNGLFLRSWTSRPVTQFSRRYSEVPGTSESALDAINKELLFPMKDVKITTTSGFVPRSGDISPDLPFAVARSTHGQLPVYSRTANGGTRRSTIVRRISGDVDKLAHDLMVVTGENEIRLRYGSIEIKGNHTKTVQQYLLGQGF